MTKSIGSLELPIMGGEYVLDTAKGELGKVDGLGRWHFADRYDMEFFLFLVLDGGDEEAMQWVEANAFPVALEMEAA